MRFSSEDGFYELNPFPGCNQLVVSNHAFIFPEHRGKGKGQKQHEERLAKIKELGYDCVICTVKCDNEIQRRILRKNEWQYVHTFHNRETDNYIELWVKNLY